MNKLFLGLPRVYPIFGLRLATSATETNGLSGFFSLFFQVIFDFDFQFNERCLIEMHEHAYSCQFGTFIGNCEKDRKVGH